MLTVKNGSRSKRLPVFTERLELRQLSQRDFEPVHDMSLEPEVTRYLAWGPRGKSHTQQLFDRAEAAAAAKPRTDFHFAIVEAATRKVVGTGGVLTDRATGYHEREIGYVIAPEAWGQGYATEVVRGLAAFGFGTLALHRLFALTDPRNPASARVLEKAGFRREGLLRNYIWTDGEWADSLLYAQLKKEHRPAVKPVDARGAEGRERS